MKNIFITILVTNAVIFGQTIDKNYVAEKKINGGAEKNGQYNFVTYSVKSNTGTELYQIVDKVDYDVPLAKLEVFENGSSVLISSFSGMLTFINNSGSEVSTKKIAENLSVEYERNILSVVDGESLILLLSNMKDGYSLIQTYSSNGNLEKEVSVDVSNINGIAFSQNLNQIYLSFVDWQTSGKPNKLMSIINNNGNELARLEANFENGFFTESNQFIGYSNNSLICFDGKNMVLNFQSKGEENKINIDATYNSGKVIVASAQEPILKDGKWLYQNPTVKQFDLKGNLVNSKVIKSNLFSEFGFKNINGKKEFSLVE